MTRYQLKNGLTQAGHSSNDLMLGMPLVTLGLSTAYAAALSYLERRLPIKPDHTWAEVAGGVLITLVPVAIAARRHPEMDWRQYEAAVWRSFIASGTPIILWQIGEAMLRQVELLRYAAAREQAPVETYADDSSTMANRSGERTGGGDPGC
ncbi:MAG: hypothetical protein RMK84_18380 [Oscillochloridaceae bacterium]|nr:hypothetical protein [Chloroflexaceae bacterium]MDW8392093.1 hypothetical protein [Oscillochloridaceae bacterium]